MLSKNKTKLVKSLALKKNRDKLGLFIAEGDKTIQELLPFLDLEFLVSTEKTILSETKIKGEHIEATQEEINSMSSLSTPRPSLAVFKIPEYSFHPMEIEQELSLSLDGIQDPGNMGTIIRIADWFGIKNIICSKDTVDIYNPKVVQATMGALARVQIHYTPLVKFLSNFNGNVFGTFLEGENIYQKELASSGTIVMGNEGNGIRKEVADLISEKLFIPPFSVNDAKVESLNVGTATAIICSEFRRR